MGNVYFYGNMTLKHWTYHKNPRHWI